MYIHIDTIALFYIIVYSLPIRIKAHCLRESE